MKDFIKWLGVNEKIAKVVVWFFIFTVMLIIINAGLDSLGLPYYKITYENIIKIKVNNFEEIITNCIVCILNFLSTMLLIFRVKEIKEILKYGILYMIFNWLITTIFGEGIVQVYMFMFFVLFAYFYSKRNNKYIAYAIISVLVNVIVQSITYYYKARFIDYAHINYLTRSLLFSDYFIIMAIIILVKEIYLKKRGEKKWVTDQEVFFGSETSKKKTNSQRN